MPDKTISYQIPASLENFQATDSPYLTKAKLKVFYKGETVDNRLFTDAFSEQLLSTIPQMPIVGYYDETVDDFVGHNNEQYIYGYVPENPELEFSEQDGKTYAFTDVVLWTGRDDNIGDVAKKIVGKSQSLEMDPNTVKYKVNKDSRGKFQNLEYTSGSITGLSILGDSQTPAFEGSAFFTSKLEEEPAYKASFVNFIKEARELLAGKKGGVSMNIEEFLASKAESKGINFMKESYREREVAIHGAIETELKSEDFYIVQLGDEEVVLCNYMTNSYQRISYSSETTDDGQTFSFNEPETVIARYLTQKEINNSFEAQEETEVVETTEVEKPENENFTEETVAEVESEVVAEETVIKETEETFTEIVTEEVKEELEVVTNKEEVFAEQSSESEVDKLASQERDELEAFRAKAKNEILDKYNEYLTEDQQEQFKASMSNYSAVEFEKELKLASFELIQEKALGKQSKTETVGLFSVNDVNPDVSESQETANLRRLLNK